MSFIIRGGMTHKRVISIPVVDHVLSELRGHFDRHQRRALLALCLVPSLYVSLEPANCTSRVKELAEPYVEDLPSRDCLESELHFWKIKWQQQLLEHGESGLPTNLALTLRHVNPCFPTSQSLSKNPLHFSVTSCSAEQVLQCVEEN